MSETTIHKDLAVLSAVLSYAVSEGYLSINPLIYARKRSNRRKTVKEYSVKYFTIEQAKWFLWALDNPIDIKHKAHTRKLKNGTTYTVLEYTQSWQLPLNGASVFSFFFLQETDGVRIWHLPGMIWILKNARSMFVRPLPRRR